MEIYDVGIFRSNEEQIVYEAMSKNLNRIVLTKKRDAILDCIYKNLVVAFPLYKVYVCSESSCWVDVSNLEEYSFKRRSYRIDFDWYDIINCVDLTHIQPSKINEWKEKSFNSPVKGHVSFLDLKNILHDLLFIREMNKIYELTPFITYVYAKISKTARWLQYKDGVSTNAQIFCADIIGLRVNAIPISLNFPFDNDFISSLSRDSTLAMALKNKTAMYLYKLYSTKSDEQSENVTAYVFDDWNDCQSNRSFSEINPFKCLLTEKLSDSYGRKIVNFKLIPFKNKYCYYRFSCSVENAEKARYAIIAYFNSGIKNRRQNFELDESFRACGILSFSKGFPLNLSILKYDLGDRQHQFNRMRIEGNQCMMMT